MDFNGLHIEKQAEHKLQSQHTNNQQYVNQNKGIMPDMPNVTTRKRSNSVRQTDRNIASTLQEVRNSIAKAMEGCCNKSIAEYNAEIAKQNETLSTFNITIDSLMSQYNSYQESNAEEAMNAMKPTIDDLEVERGKISDDLDILQDELEQRIKYEEGQTKLPKMLESLLRQKDTILESKDDRAKEKFIDEAFQANDFLRQLLSIK